MLATHLMTLSKLDIPPENVLWEDKEVKFDLPNLHKRLHKGEKILDTIQHIEDTKGNPGDTGRLLVTNLRLIWYSLVHKRYNLSIGFARIASLNIRLVHTKLRGTNQALFLLAISHNTRYEFLFTDVSGDTTHREEPIFVSVNNVHHLFLRTYLYRDLKLRGAILKSGQLILLPDEQVYTNAQGIWNLSSDQGNLGCFVVTNIRLVWYADANENFNISLPYLQIESIRIRDSKYGPALVIQTAETGGGYVLGFRIDPAERLSEIYKELYSLHSIYTENPNYGVHYDPIEVRKRSVEAVAQMEEEFKVKDFQEIDECQEREINTKLNAYLAENCLAAGAEKPTRAPVYCKELGFAMERIPDGYTLKDLWDVIPTQMENTE